VSINADKNKVRKILILGVLVLLLLLSVISSFIKRIGHEVAKTDYPQGSITNAVKLFPDTGKEVSENEVVIRCPSLPYMVVVPGDYWSKNDVVLGKVQDVEYVIYETDRQREFVLTNYLPNQLWTVVPGFSHEAEKMGEQSGYYYEYPAVYTALQVNSQISVRNEQHYILSYCLELSDTHSLYLYVAVTDKKRLAEASEVLEYITYSVRPIQMNESMDTGVVDAPAESLGDGSLSISLEKEIAVSVTDGVFVCEWMNIGVLPNKLNVYAPNGQLLTFIEEYSTPGHYVYGIGQSSSGTYKVSGSTDEVLTGVIMSVYEKESYEEQYVTFGF